MSVEADTPVKPVLPGRRAGVLLHLGSLPSSQMHDAERFLDFLKAGGFSAWQMLPIGPSDHGSPYSPYSAFAGDPSLLQCETGTPLEDELARFKAGNHYWLPDFCLFSVIRKQHEQLPWWQWPGPLRHREPGALKEFADQHADSIEEVVHLQFRFEQRWQKFRQMARDRSIQLLGDMPMFVTTDSADAWARQGFFKLDEEGHPTEVAGCPPDDYSDEGQCWNNPVYDWQALQADHFCWWQERLARELGRFDLLRWDHFRGLESGWEIPAGTADHVPVPADGAWCKVPGRELLASLQRKFGQLPILAENLGVITAEVEDLRHEFGLPGMHVLQFGFDGDPANPHLPDQHETNGVVYTGTHDNDTTQGWFESLDDSARAFIAQTMRVDQQDIPKALVKAVLESRCAWAIFPMQDLLGLGSAARLNTPGEAEGQWTWRFNWNDIPRDLSRRWRRDIRRARRQEA